jgi:deoxyribose-phosphate aldolase
MALVLLREMDSRFQADLWTQALAEAGIAHVLRTWQDTAYDGLFLAQKGYAALYVDQAHLARAQAIDADLAGQTPAEQMSPARLARCLDHTLLDPGAGLSELGRHLDQCLEMNAAAACLLPWMVPAAAQALAGSAVAVCSVVDFPLGAGLARCKREEAQALFEAGARELDVVVNRGLIASGQLEQAAGEVAALAQDLPGALVKVILETPQLGPELSQRLAGLLLGSRVGFLKTGTGHFGPATVTDVQMLRAVAGLRLGVKAAGGIRALDEALAMLGAGADRLGTSNGFGIWQEARARWAEQG